MRAILFARASGTIALSPNVFGEISEVLARPKLARLIPTARRTDILQLLSAAADWFRPTETVLDCRDAKDNIYLELALAARAPVILSGDSDLLTLDPWRGVRVLQARSLLDWIETP